MFYYRIVYCVFGESSYVLLSYCVLCVGESSYVLLSYCVLCIWGIIICFIIVLCIVYLGNHHMFYYRIVYCVFGESSYVLLSYCVLCVGESSYVLLSYCVLCIWGIIICFIIVLCIVYLGNHHVLLSYCVLCIGEIDINDISKTQLL